MSVGIILKIVRGSVFVTGFRFPKHNPSQGLYGLRSKGACHFVSQNHTLFLGRVQKRSIYFVTCSDLVSVMSGERPVEARSAYQ